VISGDLVPSAGFSKALFDVDANFMVVSHGEFTSSKLGRRGLLRILVSQLFVLLEHALEAEEEPSAHTKGSFSIALLRS
jgi:hypothetical protein